MISNKTLTFAAVAFATANGLSVQSKLNAQAQVEAEAQFLNSFGDALEDAQDWCWRSAQKWPKQDVIDIGDAFDLRDPFDFGDPFKVWEYAGDWMEDPDIWEILGKTIVSPVYTPDFNCDGGPSHEEMCLTFEPQPGELIPDNPPNYYNDYEETYTMDFNYNLEYSGIPSKMIYGLFGDVNSPDYRRMRTRDCEAVDCLNPCYGDGSCFKCADAALESARETGDYVRIPVCDQCTIPSRVRGRR